MDVLVDLQHQNEGRATQYDAFWTKRTEYISESFSLPLSRPLPLLFVIKVRLNPPISTISS